MFNRVLVANRGEVAVRVLRTLREMGISSVAVYSDADRDAPHVRMADSAYRLGPSPPRESYLNVARVLAAARESGADAVHPGYGFLAENHHFARALLEAGITFIGPPAAVIERLRRKTTAREIFAQSGVPILPGTLDSPTSLAEFASAAERIGYPVIIKPAVGGGGKGLQVVNSPAQLAAGVQACAREAQSAFGESAIYLEKYLEHARHLEIQVLADRHGEMLQLFERECSIQRRHQKIVEETPSPALTPTQRAELGAAALRAMSAAGYVNAGTVEFLLDERGRFYFLEVNSRLQMEHAITELTLGVDLVRKQIEIAAGRPLGLTQDSLAPRGHAIECRLYAETPARSFLPSPGTITHFAPAEGPFVRFEHALRVGAHLPRDYDPILGKLVVWAENRPAAIARMIRALEENVILGVATSTELLIAIVGHDRFRAGAVHTQFIEDELTPFRSDELYSELAGAAYLVARGLERPGSGAPRASLEPHASAVPPSVARRESRQSSPRGGPPGKKPPRRCAGGEESAGRPAPSAWGLDATPKPGAGVSPGPWQTLARFGRTHKSGKRLRRSQ